MRAQALSPLCCQLRGGQITCGASCTVDPRTDHCPCVLPYTGTLVLTPGILAPRNRCARCLFYKQSTPAFKSSCVHNFIFLCFSKEKKQCQCANNTTRSHFYSNAPHSDVWQRRRKLEIHTGLDRELGVVRAAHCVSHAAPRDFLVSRAGRRAAALQLHASRRAVVCVCTRKSHVRSTRGPAWQ